jgi:hypothetical protein
VKGDLTKVASLRRLPMNGQGYELVAGADGASMLLLEGEQLRRLGADGLTVREDVQTPKSYERIRERPGYYVAPRRRRGQVLDFIDKRSLKVTSSIPMDYRARFRSCFEPGPAECYVTVEKPTNDGLRSDILIVSEKSGDVREPEDFIGRWVRVSADGKTLYAGYKEIFEKGSRLLINPDRIHVVPEYGKHRPDPRLRRVSNGAAAGEGEGRRRRQRLRHRALRRRPPHHVPVGRGYPQISYNISAWDPADFTKRPVTYPTRSTAAGRTKSRFTPCYRSSRRPAARSACWRSTARPESCSRNGSTSAPHPCRRARTRTASTVPSTGATSSPTASKTRRSRHPSEDQAEPDCRGGSATRQAPAKPGRRASPGGPAAGKRKPAAMAGSRRHWSVND